MGKVRVVELGLACCGLEYHSGLAHPRVREAMASLEEHDVDVLVLAGTITEALRNIVLAEYEELGPERAVIGFGACTISGGPYWDSYSVLPGAPIPLDIVIPGCPPPPTALVDGFTQLQALLIARAAS